MNPGQFNINISNFRTRLQTRTAQQINNNNNPQIHDNNDQAHIVMTPDECFYGSMREFACNVLHNDPTTYKDIYSIPSGVDDAWNHPDPVQRKMWRAAIMKEFDKMSTMKVYRKIDRALMPNGRRCVKCRWVSTSSAMELSEQDW